MFPIDLFGILIILSNDNRKDVEEIDAKYLSGLTFHYVSEMYEVIKLAITNQHVLNPKKF